MNLEIARRRIQVSIKCAYNFKQYVDEINKINRIQNNNNKTNADYRLLKFMKPSVSYS